MECKNKLTDLLSETKLDFQSFYSCNKNMSKRQKMTKRGILRVYQFFKNAEENKTRRNKINILDYDIFYNVNIFGKCWRD